MKRKSSIAVIIVLIFATMAFVNVACASPTIHTVCQSGCEYTKIQDAINAADPDDTIHVYSGTYYENVIVNKTLTLRGWNTWGGGKPIVDAKDTSDAFTLEADGIRLENFTVTHTKDGYYYYAGIAVSSNECKIIDNEIRSNGLFGIEIFSANNTILGNNISNSVMNGIYLGSDSHDNNICDNNASNNHLAGIADEGTNNTISRNYVNDNKDGIYLKKGSNNIIIENYVSNNLIGIYLTSSRNNIVTNNTVTGNYASDKGSGILLDNSTNNKIKGNNISNNNNSGIHLQLSSENNKIKGNNISSNNNIGIYLDFVSNNNITGNTAINNNRNGIYLYRASNNNITSNTAINNNKRGISLTSISKNNSIKGNNIHNNKNGIYLCKYSSYNIIYLNNFINNTDNICPNSSKNNIWSSKEKIEYTYKEVTYTNYTGNYWYDYNGIDDNGDGVGDTVYTINFDKDIYPLMREFENYRLASLFCAKLKVIAC